MSFGYLVFKSLAVSSKQNDPECSLLDEKLLNFYYPVGPIQSKSDTPWKLGVLLLKAHDYLQLIK